MNKKSAIAAVALAVGLQGAAIADDQRQNPRQAPASKTVDRGIVDKLLADWPAKPKSVAYQMMKKYGMPNIAGAEMLVWHNNGPWKRTTVYREEVPHHFPKVHTDLLEQVVEVKIPADKLDDLAKFDGAVSYHGTTGELAARCDMEAANFLAINLAVEVANGKKSVAQAREAYGKNVVALFTSEQPPAYVQKLTFEPTKAAGQTDKVTLPGAPRPAAAGDSSESISDREVLAALINANLAEIQMTSFVIENTKNDQVQSYARLVKKDHASGLQKAMQLGQKAKIQPVAGGPVPEMKQSAAENMAKLAQQDGAAFERTFIAMSVDGHQRKLDMIDKKLLPAAESPQLKAALTDARQTIAKHLQLAKQLQGTDRVSTR